MGFRYCGSCCAWCWGFPVSLFVRKTGFSVTATSWNAFGMRGNIRTSWQWRWQRGAGWKTIVLTAGLMPGIKVSLGGYEEMETDEGDQNR